MNLDHMTPSQREGTEALLEACKGFPVSHTAHVLAEVWHETGGGMQPVKETVFAWHSDRDPADAEVIRRLDAAWNKGQLPWVSSPYWREGYFGRGQIQLTHEFNYDQLSSVVGVDLVKNPGKALDLDVSAKVAAEGCRLGLFTGKKLSDFDGGVYNHRLARSIVNGDGASVGKEIQRKALEFEALLTEEGRPRLSEGDSGMFVKDLQVQLRSLGYALGHTDGEFGARTRDAVMAFQADRGVSTDGVVGSDTWGLLKKSAPRPPRQVTEKDLEDRGSQTIKKAKSVERALGNAEAVTGGGLTLGAGLEIARSAQDIEGALDAVLRLLTTYWPLLLVLGVILLVSRYGKKALREIRKARVEDAQSGRNLSR